MSHPPPHGEHPDNQALDRLLAQSRGTDIPVLLKAKETAKRLVHTDPSPANLAVLHRATTMLEAAAMDQAKDTTNLPDTAAVLAYLEEQGRKIKKTKLYQEIKNGRLKRQADLSFRRRDVDRYAASLPVAEIPDAVINEAGSRLRRKEEADIRLREAEARRKELALSIAEGRSVARSRVDQELAARAVTLNTGLKTALESQVLELIAVVGGDAGRAHLFLRDIEILIDQACNHYSQELEFEVTFDDDPTPISDA